MTRFDVLEQPGKGGWAEAEKISHSIDFFGPVSAHVTKSRVALAGVANADVLDLRCGNGEMTGQLVEYGSWVTRLDFSPRDWRAPDAGR